METLASAGYGRVVWYRSSFANTRSALVVARAKGAPEVTSRDGDKSQTLIHLHKMGSEMALRDRIAPVVAESSGGKAVLWLVADNDEDFGSSLGLARCLRNEHAKLDARCALLPSAWSLAERKAALDRLRGSSFIAERELRFTDDGRCLVPRVVVTEGSDSSMGIAFRDDASYLFAGGLSALGIALCEWMYARGARHFVLTSRSGAKTIAGDDDSNVNARRSLEALRRLAGCTVELLACDASDRVAMADLVNSLQMPLAGVWLMPLVLVSISRDLWTARAKVHLPIVKRDAPLLQQTAENFKTSYEVKLEPVRVLHSILDTDKLDFVAFFSTVSTLAGIPSQSNYVAASLAAEEIVNALPNGLSLTVPALDDIGAFYRNFVLDRQGKFRLVRNQLRGLRTSSHHLLHFFDVAFTRFIESRSMAWGARSRRATYAPDLDWTLLKEEFAQLNMVLPHYAEHLVRATKQLATRVGCTTAKAAVEESKGVWMRSWRRSWVCQTATGSLLQRMVWR
ncbi:hypothetical protein L7F22_022999 [Adiantum nelumboides]|nr:hypothetical protein [Adiantum nelumboides]